MISLFVTRWSASLTSLCSQHEVCCLNLAQGPFMNWPLLTSPTSSQFMFHTKLLTVLGNGASQNVILGLSPPTWVFTCALSPAGNLHPTSSSNLSPAMNAHFFSCLICARSPGVRLSDFSSEVFLEHPGLS